MMLISSHEKSERVHLLSYRSATTWSFRNKGDQAKMSQRIIEIVSRESHSKAAWSKAKAHWNETDHALEFQLHNMT